MELSIRSATVEDAARLTDIYRYYVEETTASFEQSVPSIIQMRDRIQTLNDDKYPFIIAHEAQQIIGYAYVSPFRERAGYRYTVEDSVYVAQGYTGKGVGSLLLEHLIKQSQYLQYKEMLASITSINNDASIHLHEKFNFKKVGHLTNIGYKFNQWIDVLLYQRSL